MQTPIPMLPLSHLLGDVNHRSQLRSEGMHLEIKAFDTGGSICVSPIHKPRFVPLPLSSFTPTL